MDQKFEILKFEMVNFSYSLHQESLLCHHLMICFVKRKSKSETIDMIRTLEKIQKSIKYIKLVSNQRLQNQQQVFVDLANTERFVTRSPRPNLIQSSNEARKCLSTQGSYKKSSQWPMINANRNYLSNHLSSRVKTPEFKQTNSLQRNDFINSKKNILSNYDSSDNLKENKREIIRIKLKSEKSTTLRRNDSFQNELFFI
jgi:hypothetical protein